MVFALYYGKHSPVDSLLNRRSGQLPVMHLIQ
jgi:hypothetical protein